MFNNKKILWMVFVCLICGSFGGGYAQSYSPRVGEVLAYKVIAKKFIYGANQVVRVISEGVYNGHRVFNVQYTFNTIGLVWNITKYREREDLVLDEEGMYPLFARREIQENGKLMIEETSFDYANGYAIRNVDNNGKDESFKVKLPGLVQDNLSLQFFLRKMLLNEGIKKIYVYSFGKIEEVDCEITKIKEPINLEVGSYPQYFQIASDKAKITLLFADNAERLPLIIRKIADFGKVEACLSNIN